MDRRKLILQGGATVLAAGAAGPAIAEPLRAGTARISKVSPAINPGILRICRERPNIASLSAADLAALKTGVSTMMSRGPNDPTSWSYQAAMHSTYTTPVQPLWNGCQHGTIHFLSWHRLFLYYFERILRAASGSPTLMLPYWNWGADRALPAPFRDSTPGNPLYTTHRGSGINGGALLPASAVSASAALADINFNNFSPDLEGTPHGSVHVSVGGWMHDIPTAGQDPIFWLHHCNIDRLWEYWLSQGGGRANPTSASWLNQTFSFYDETGTQRTVAASRGLNTCRSLGYHYPTGLKVRPFPWALISLLLEAEAMQIRPPPPNAQPQALTLGSKPAEARLAIPAAAAAGRVYLAFEDISAENTEGYYEIYFNPPGEKYDFEDPSYAGNLVLFGLSPRELAVKHGGMEMGPPRRVFDITRKLAQMRRTKALDGSSLRVVLVLRTPEGGGAEAAQGSRARIGRVALIAQ